MHLIYTVSSIMRTVYALAVVWYFIMLCKDYHTGNKHSSTLQWRHNGRDGISNHQPRDCLLNRLFWYRSKKISKFHVTGLCEGNSPVTGKFPAQRNSNADNVSIWWRYHIENVWGGGQYGDFVTHWGRVTHICVSKLTIIGSDNGLSSGRRQAIIWTNAEILLIGPLVGTNFSEILMEIHTFSFKKMHLKMSSGKGRPFCLGLNVLKQMLLYQSELPWAYI